MTQNFKWFPIIEGKKLDYHDYFALTGSSVAFLIAMVCFFIQFLINILSNSNSSPYNNKRDSVSTQDSQINGHYYKLNQSLEMTNLELLQNQNKELDPQLSVKKNNSCCSYITFFTAGFFFLSLIPLFLGALGLIPTLLSIILMIGIFQLEFKIQNRVFQTKSNGISKAALLYCILVPLFAHNTCISFYNDEIGLYSSLLGFDINTQFTRLFQLPTYMCPPGPPCHFYATLPEDTAHSVFINLHTHKNIENVVVHYDLASKFSDPLSPTNVLAFSEPAVLFEIDQVESKAERNVHSALILNLQPNTKYALQIKYLGDKAVQATQIYKTLPDKHDPNLNITMINAGDAGNTKQSRKFNNFITTLQPDIFLMGGDIAYDDNFETCYFTWDYYLSGLEKAFNTLGYLIPMVWSVGNHDVGLNELPLVNITLTATKGPAYLSYFPQHFNRGPNFQILFEVPPLENRRTVFHHDIANSVYLSLDSGYLHDFSGWQEDYIVSTLQQSPNTFKFANYHVPIYRSCGEQDTDDSEATMKALLHWVPRFDQFRMATVYENHVHAFKRTYPLVASAVASNGTVYLGDGAYGAIVDQCAMNSTRPIFATASSTSNFWVTQVTQDKLYHRAYNGNTVIIDEYQQEAAYYREI